MKLVKSISLILVLCMAVNLCACAAQNVPDASSVPDTPPVQTIPVEQEAQNDPATGDRMLVMDPTITPSDAPQVVYLSGSWYDMGVQFAQQDEYALTRQYFKSATDLLVEYGDEAAMYEVIGGYMDQVKEECPDLYDFVRGVDDTLEHFDFVQSAIASVCCYVNGIVVPELLCMNISAWGSATADGHLLAATNGDTNLDDPFQSAAIMILLPDNGYATICSSGGGSNAYMNDQGVIVLCSGGQDALETDHFTTLISCWAQAYSVTQSANADEQLAWDQRSDMFHACVGNTHIVDISGTGYVFENTAGHSAVRASGDFGEDNYLIANNHFLTEEMQSSLLNDGTLDDCPIRYDTVEQIFKENFGSLNIGLMHEAIASRRYYLDGQWSGENWSQDEDTFYSSDTSNAFCKTTTRTLMDVNELTLYRQLGSSDPFNNHNPNATARFCRITLADSPMMMNLIADTDAAFLINLAAYDLDHEASPDRTLVDNLNQAKQYYAEGQSYAMMAGYYNALGDVNTANWMYSRASTSHVLAQQYAQNAMIRDNSYTAVEGESYTH